MRKNVAIATRVSLAHPEVASNVHSVGGFVVQYTSQLLLGFYILNID